LVAEKFEICPNSFQLATRFYSNGASNYFCIYCVMIWIRPMVKSRR